MGRHLSPCGTNAAYERHRRRHEPIDEPCRQAHAAYERIKRMECVVDEAAEICAEARVEALEALSHRHPQEFARLLAAAERELVEERIAS